MPPQALLTIGALTIVLAISFFAFSNESMSTLWITMMVLPVIYLFNRPDIWLGIIVVLYKSALTLPWFPTNLNLFHILSAAFAVFILMYRGVNKKSLQVKAPTKKWAFMFLLVLVLVISYRGIGIRYFGSSLWGGAGYVSLLVSIAIFLLGDIPEISSKIWKRAVVSLCVLSMLPMLAQLVYALSGGAIQYQYLFVQTLGVTESSSNLMADSSHVVRLQAGTGFWIILIPLLLFEKPFSVKHLPVSIFIWAIAFLAISFSGFRSGFLVAALLQTTWLFFGERKFQWGKPVLAILLIAAVLCLMALFANHFPLSAQRALSFIPFANIENAARDSATVTVDWRIDVWKRAITEILPKYLWIGQGLAFNPRDLQEIIALGLYDREWAFVTRSYHNGPISLLLILGIPGAIAGFGFLIFSFKEYYTALRLEWNDAVLFRIYRVAFAWFVTMIIMFCTAYGDLQMSFPEFFFVAMLLGGMIKTRTLGMKTQALQTVSAPQIPHENSTRS